MKRRAPLLAAIGGLLLAAIGGLLLVKFMATLADRALVAEENALRSHAGVWQSDALRSTL